MLSNCGVEEDSWDPLDCKEIQPVNPKGSFVNIHWKDWFWSWSSNILAPWCKETSHWKRPRCWERLQAGREGGGREWGDWMASPTRWTWVWVSVGDGEGSWASVWSQRVENDWDNELNWTCMKCSLGISIFLKTSLVFSILLFSYISLHWLLKKVLLSFLAFLWGSAFRQYIFPFLLCL